MEHRERVRALVEGCAWVRDSGLALSLIPALAEDLPAWAGVHGSGPRIPTPAAGAIARALAKVLPDLLQQAKSGDAPELSSFDRGQLQSDPLVRTLTAMFAQTTRKGLRSHTVPAIVTAWATREILLGRMGSAGLLEPAELGAVDEAAQQLMAVEDEVRMNLVARIGRSVAGRVGAAMALAAGSGLRIPTGDLYRVLLPNVLVLNWTKTTFKAERDLPLASAALGLQLTAAQIADARKALQFMIAAADAAKPSNPLSALTTALEGWRVDSKDPMSAILHPLAAPWILRSLPHLTTVKDLKAAGVSAAFAKSVCDPAGARAASAAWRSLTEGIAVYDLLSTLLDRVMPVRWDRGRAMSPSGPLGEGVMWSWLCPSDPAEPLLASVVAVRLDEVLAVARAAGSQRDELVYEGILVPLWERLASEAGAGLWSMDGDLALAAFPTVREAVVFASNVVAHLSGPAEVGEAPRDLVIPASVHLSAGVSWGAIVGGTDGVSHDFGGAAVREAVVATGLGELGSPADDPVGVRGASVDDSGLQSQGVVIHAAAQGQLLGELDAAGGVYHKAGTRSRAGGLDLDFEHYPVPLWFEEGDAVYLLLALGRGGLAISEVKRLDREGLSELHLQDKEVSRMAARSLDRSAAPGPDAAPAVDPFGAAPSADAVAPEVTLAPTSAPSSGPPEPDPFGFVEGATGPVGSGGASEARKSDWAEPGGLRFGKSTGSDSSTEQESSDGAPSDGGQSEGASITTPASHELTPGSILEESSGIMHVDDLEGEADTRPLGELAEAVDTADEAYPSDDADPHLADSPSEPALEGDEPHVHAAPMFFEEIPEPQEDDTHDDDQAGIASDEDDAWLGLAEPEPAEVAEPPGVGDLVGAEDGDPFADFQDETRQVEDPFASAPVEPVTGAADNDPDEGLMFGEDPDEVADEDEDFAFGSDDDSGSDRLDLDDAADADGPMVSIEDDEDDEDEWEEEYGDSWASDEQAPNEEASDDSEEFFLPGLTDEAGRDGAPGQGADADPRAEPTSPSDGQPHFGLPSDQGGDVFGERLDDVTEHHDEDGEAGLAFAMEGSDEPGDRAAASDDVFADSDPHEGVHGGGEFAFVLDGGAAAQHEVEAAPDQLGVADADVASGDGAAASDSGSDSVHDDGGMGSEMVRLFGGHVITRAPSGAFRFGLRDGDRLRDVHDFDTRGDVAAAYEAFVRAKIAEGFIPQVHLAEVLDPDQEFESLAEDQVRAATQVALGGG